jgi:hypothetical protein
LKKIILLIAILFFVSLGPANAQPKPIRIVLAPNSVVDRVELIKKLGSQCPNVSITLNSKESDFMLEAGGWSGNYRFILYRHGGQAVYSTNTVMLSNAVKDVCTYVSKATY